MKEVLGQLIAHNRGPWKDYSTETRSDCVTICEAVTAQVVATILGVHPGACEEVSAEYDFYGDIWVYLTFSGKATRTAKEIASAFYDISGVEINVKVWESVSEHASK
jgi:hypothetical protein